MSKIEIEDRSEAHQVNEEPWIDARKLLRADMHLAEALTALWHSFQNLHQCVLRAVDVLAANPHNMESARYFLIPAEAAFEYALINFRAASVAYSTISGSADCEIMEGFVASMRLQVQQATSEMNASMGEGEVDEE